jgi:hypothetical protein
VDNCQLDPADERFAPMLLALGRAVVGAGALENVLLLEIAQRRVGEYGLAEPLGRELAQLERKPAGELLRTLTELGIPAELAARIRDVIERRNLWVHHLMEDVEVLRLLASPTSERVSRVVARIDQLAKDCGEIIAELAPAAFVSLEAAFGATLSELHAAIRAVDLGTVTDDRLREQLTAIASIETAQMCPPSGYFST